jgi:hypothetical protein
MESARRKTYYLPGKGLSGKNEWKVRTLARYREDGSNAPAARTRGSAGSWAAAEPSLLSLASAAGAGCWDSS